MLSRITPYLVAFTPAILWQVLTFILSTSLASSDKTIRLLLFVSYLFGLGLERNDLYLVLNAVLRKMAHLLLYMVFALLVVRGFRSLPEDSWKPDQRMQWVWTLGMVFCFALLDEFHQSLVVERTGSLFDVLLDSAGGMMGMLGIWLLGRVRNRRAPGRSPEMAA